MAGSTTLSARRAKGSTIRCASNGNGGQAAMSTKRRRTLARIHHRPPPADLGWQDVVGTLEYYGVEVTEREGSRVGLKKGEERIIVHRPHPGSVTGRETVRDIAAFLAAAGVIPPQEHNDG